MDENENQETIEQPKSKIKSIIIKIFCFIIFLILILFGYMHFIEPKLLITHEYAIYNENLPESFTGFKIAHFSDIHFGRTTNEKEVENIIIKINEMKPDIVVFTGDLFDSYITLSDKNIQFLKDSLKKINAKLGKYAIFGDSDYLNESKYTEIMKEANFTILENQNIPLFYKNNTPILLSGIPSISKGKQDYNKALTKPLEGNYYQIFLTHEPIAYTEVKNNANLVLAGHSLGGLIHLPFSEGIIKKNNVGEYMNGKYQNQDTILFVSNGIGTEDISLRFGNIPSINLYRLYKK